MQLLWRIRPGRICGDLTPSPYEHQDLTDDDLLWLIGQVIEHPGDNALVGYYSQLVDLNAKSAIGLTDAIFCEGLTDAKAILAHLRQNPKRVIQL